MAIQPGDSHKNNGEKSGFKDWPTARRVLIVLSNNARHMAACGGINSIRASVAGKEFTVFLCNITIRRSSEGAYEVERAHVGKGAELASVKELLRAGGAQGAMGEVHGEQGGVWGTAVVEPGAARGGRPIRAKREQVSGFG